MNKYQEALKWFNSIHDEIGNEDYYEDLGIRFGQGLAESIETVEELIDKEIPMKPKKNDITNHDWNIGFCPNCGQWLMFTGAGCINNGCRQKIDWSDKK